MEKLELKHIAPYLPYKLNCCLMGEDTQSFLIEGARHNYMDVWSLKTITEEWNYTEVFPILRPLSDLTKEIKLWDEGQFIVGGERIREWYDLDPRRCTYEQFCYLLENHYDVFGLIKKGLAIDINTI